MEHPRCSTVKKKQAETSHASLCFCISRCLSARQSEKRSWRLDRERFVWRRGVDRSRAKRRKEFRRRERRVLISWSPEPRTTSTAWWRWSRGGGRRGRKNQTRCFTSSFPHVFPLSSFVLLCPPLSSFVLYFQMQCCIHFSLKLINPPKNTDIHKTFKTYFHTVRNILLMWSKNPPLLLSFEI